MEHRFFSILLGLALLSLLSFFVSFSIKQQVFTKIDSSEEEQEEPSYHSTTTNQNLPPNWMPDIPLIKYLHKVQHPANCSSRKFLVYPMPKLQKRDVRNLGALVTSLWRWVILALEDDRTVVIDSTNWNMADCPHNDGSEGGLNCYFEPFSSCDMSHVLAVLLFFVFFPPLFLLFLLASLSLREREKRRRRRRSRREREGERETDVPLDLTLSARLFPALNSWWPRPSRLKLEKHCEIIAW